MTTKVCQWDQKSTISLIQSGSSIASERKATSPRGEENKSMKINDYRSEEHHQKEHVNLSSGTGAGDRVWKRREGSHF